MNRQARLRCTALLAATLFALVSCADSRTQIRIVGSSTVFPFTTAVAENFSRNNPEYLAPIVEATGTGGGIKLFCAGLGSRFPDVVNASRRMKASELRDCARNGAVHVVEIQVGIDGVVLAQGKGGAAFDLSLRDVYAALAAEPFGRPQTAKTWKDVNPALPAVRIEVIGPPPTSGTRDAFNELYMEPGCDTDPAMRELKKADSARHKTVCNKIREDGAYVEAGENDNLIVQKLAANPQSVGVLGFSFLERNLDTIRDVPIDGVMASYETISDFTYPAARPLFIYVKAQHVKAIRGLREFLDEYTSERAWGPGGYLQRRGLVPSPDSVREANRARAETLAPLAAEELA
ncbi:substrate-binding domain-containing protein [Sandaracinobacter sp. RS1-74]|uniref:substrate-binding domain-containing protein n=1 Tax=Sandaracinobacteroides sayramensis TaxID=2913411 RepID=UPI001EDC8F23|nr:substrate-binding domain-containing protein [Sandaracinobacteroides sayramensis]MCG2841024.1 substrate-binding domain-containing protein [Sandaracinobacteroides sayramensis]